MIALQLRINNSTLLVNVQCIRIEPQAPREGDLCTYEARIYNQAAGTIHHRYSDDIGLAKKMLDFYKQIPEKRIQWYRFQEMTKELNDTKPTP